MASHPRAGQPAQQSDLINVAQLTSQYYVLKPDLSDSDHAVKFGTSGHRGSSARQVSMRRIFWRLPRRLRKNAAKTVSPGLAMSGKIPMRCLNRR